MSPERDDFEDEEEEEELDEERRGSILRATWFRALLGVVVLGVIFVLALPYVLEWGRSSPTSQSPVAKAPEAPPAGSPVPPPPAAVTSPPPQAFPAAPTVASRPAAPASPTAPEPISPTETAVRPKTDVRETAGVASPSPARSPAVTDATGKRAAAVPTREAAPARARGDFWVQVGAFREAENATGLAAQLTDQKYPVQRATVRRPAGGGSEVFVANVSAQDLLERLKGKGYQAKAVKGGAVVRPPLPLRDAVHLSKELTDAGLGVKIRRVSQESDTFHLVRVGGFTGRQQAAAAREELAAKGFGGFVVKGPPR